MKILCEVCGEREYTQLCDHSVGTAIITSANFNKPIAQTCDRKLCKSCAVKLWVDCDVCPEHASELIETLVFKRN